MCEQLVVALSAENYPMLVVGAKPQRSGSKLQRFENCTHIAVFGKAMRAELDNNNRGGR